MKEFSIKDFWAYRPSYRKFIYEPTGEFWSKKDINRCVRTPTSGIYMDASTWLFINRGVEQIVIAPNEPKIIYDNIMCRMYPKNKENKFLSGNRMIYGGWYEQLGVKCFNLWGLPKGILS